MSAYGELEARYRRIDALGGALSVLSWDQATMMPAGGAEARAEQMATLSVIRHSMLTDPMLGDLMSAAEDAAIADPWQAANLREMRRAWRHANALGSRLVDARARASSACEMRWRTARADNDFAGLLPSFEPLLELTREVAAAKGEAFGCQPYDALLDEYEPGGRAQAIDVHFAELAASLPSILSEAVRRQAAQGRPALPAGPFPVAAQRALGVRLMEALGFDFRHGRLDVSLHPFTGGVPDDIRITTRYTETDFTRALMGVLHETGHALYERGLPAAWRGQPVGEARGMTAHESQSLLIEMQVCRGREFLSYLAPLLREAFGGVGPYWREESLARIATKVEPGLIRVDADEVTYPLHVILRYRIERQLLAGELALADLPEAWRRGMRDLLGVEAPDDRDGCLQDIHWPSGSFGYFPTYTLGAMAAAQLFAAACEQDAAIKPGIAKGDFAPLLAWLKTKVHGRGSLDATTDDLLVHATGKPLGVAAFEAHLCARYLAA
jgi:carboxypeptidase Taq